MPPTICMPAVGKWSDLKIAPAEISNAAMKPVTTLILYAAVWDFQCFIEFENRRIAVEITKKNEFSNKIEVPVQCMVLNIMVVEIQNTVKKLDI